MAISEKVKRKLWASSGGYCGNPDCHNELLPFFESGDITNIEEIAHIIGKKEKAARGKSELTSTERDEFENLILLCPNCHTKIDKSPKLFPVKVIKQWKENHEQSIKNIFTTPKFKTRKEIRDFISPILAENKIIFSKYGPGSQNALEKQSECELQWEKLSLQKLLPNNWKLEKVIENNQALLSSEEFALFVEFKLHRDGFEQNKISGDVNATVPTFPPDFENIFL
jgi:hypothetical protein